MNKFLFQAVANRGVPPVSFLQELLDWGQTAAEEIFAPNANASDVYATVKAKLADVTNEGGDPKYVWRNPLQRRAALLEVMRVHAGFESSWKWTEGVDLGNAHSRAHIEGQETGIFQVSFDSTDLASGAMRAYAEAHGIETPEKFIPAMKSNHVLALDYYARLMRQSVAWAGPVKRHEIDPYLSREAVQAFMEILSAAKS